MRRPLPLFLAGLLLLTACAGGGVEPLPTRDALRAAVAEHDLVVVLLDAAAAGHFGHLGHERATTPHIDAIARESVVFERAYAQASATPLSVHSMLSSRYPPRAGAPTLGGEVVFEVPASAHMLPEVLGELFGARLGVSGNNWIARNFGFDQGFTDFVELWDTEQVPDAGVPLAERMGQVFGPWYARHDGQRRFAYLHYLEPHEPYLPPEPYYSRFEADAGRSIDGSRASLVNFKHRRPRPRQARNIEGLYDGHLAYVDAQVGELVDGLREAGRWDSTIFVLVSDHGEAFWQHGKWGHGLHVYEEYVHVPFLLRVPGFDALEGRRIARPVELVDLLPTLMDLLGRPAGWIAPEGESLVGLVLGEEPEGPPRAFFRNSTAAGLEFGARGERYKWVLKLDEGVEELYDLAEDPGEQRDLSAVEPLPPAAVALKRELGEWIRRPAPDARGSVVGVDSLGAEVEEQLRALGYFH